MDPRRESAILSHYQGAPRLRRWHMRARLRSGQYDALLPDLEGTGTLLDIGCGFGLLAWFLAETRPGWRYYGCDVDAAKVDLAMGSALSAEAPEPAPRFHCGPAGSTLEWPPAGWPPSFDAIVILDVLYLMPWSLQADTLGWALDHLAPGPQSRLLLKVTDPAAGWRTRLSQAEECLMVHVLRATRSSGTHAGSQPLEAYEEFARVRGWHCHRRPLPGWNPSALLRIQR